MRVVKGVLDRTLESLEFLAAEPRWMRLSDIAERLQLPKGAAHRMLAQLAVLGWVEQDEATNQYRLTMKLALLGQEYLEGTGVPSLVQPILDEVATKCRELVRMTVVEGGGLSWIAASQGASPGLMYQPKMTGRVFLHSTAVGKAWLSTMMDEEAIRAAFASGLGKPGFGGPRAVRSVSALLKELHLTRERGYATAVEEAEAGVTAMAVAVLAQRTKRVIGTVSLAGPLTRITPATYDANYQLLRRASERLGTIWPVTDAGAERYAGSATAR
jgi:DNA-binding IclR family transcriptional regulator